MGSLIYFTTNPSEYDDLEGVIVSEQVPPGFVAGADRSVVGIAGETLRGPVDKPIVITGQSDFQRIFGHRSRFNDTTLVNEVFQAFANKPFGPRVVVVRAAATGATSGTRTYNATATPVLTVAASSPGAWSLDMQTQIAAATDGVSTHFNLVVFYRGTTVTYENININAGANNIAEIVPVDDAVLVTVTKLADGRPDNAALASMAGGANGTIGDTDYTAADRAMDKIANYPGISLCMVAKRSTAAIKAKIKTLADAAVDRMWAMWNGSNSATVSDCATDVASYRSDRIVYCWNSPTIIDPEVATSVEVPPHHFMASIFSQTDVDWHVASKRTLKQTSAIKSVHFQPSRGDLIIAKNAGLCALEQLKSGFRFRSGVTTSLDPALLEIARRRQADFLQLSVSERLEDYVDETDTRENNNAIIGEIDAFSASYRDQERIVEDYAILGEDTNAQGVKVLKWRVALIKHMKHLVLETEIGTGVTIESAA